MSKAWNEVFNKQSFRAKILSKFSTQMLMDVEKLERKIWKSSKNILVWTANSEEVAYVEDRHKNCQIIHFINQSGELRSRKVKGMSARFGVGNIWIIHNIILVKTDSNLYAITKEGLEQSTITSFDKDDRIQAFTTHFNPAIGVRFLYYISGNFYRPCGQEERGDIHISQVPIDYSEKKDFGGCMTGHFYEEEDIELRFSDDGSHFICHNRDMQLYAIEKSEKYGAKMTMLWEGSGNAFAWRANSKYVVDARRRFLSVRKINDEDGDEDDYDFYPNGLDLNDYCIDIHDIILTDRHVFALFSYWKGGMKMDIVLTVDLEAHEARHAIGNDTAVDATRMPRFPPWADRPSQG